MTDFLDKIRVSPPLLLDGGLGTMLMAAGLPAGAPPECWVLERPEALAEVYRAYVRAGSDAVHSCTFGANTLRLAPFGMSETFEAVNRAAVKLARQSGASLVLGDIGPSGDYLPPVGKADRRELYDAFLAQGRLLADCGVDAFHVETMSDVREARAAVTALRQAAPEIPVMVSLTFDKKRRGFFTIMGDKLAPTLRAMVNAGADVVGANCTLTSPDMIELAKLAVAAVDVPVVLQPNAGQPVPSADGVRYDQQPGVYATDMLAIVDAGVTVVGGCCGTDPSFIRALRDSLDGR